MWVLWFRKYIVWCWYLNVLCVARHIGKSLSRIIKRYRCYTQCLPALSPLSLPLMFKEDLILKKIHCNRDSINIQGDPIPLRSNPIQPSWKLKQSRWHHRASTPTTALLSISRLFCFSLSHLLITEHTYSSNLLVSCLCAWREAEWWLCCRWYIYNYCPKNHRDLKEIISLFQSKQTESFGVCRSQLFTSLAIQHFEANRS